MSSISPTGPVVKVKPSPNVYTLLVILAVIFLGLAVGFAMYNLMVNYGFSFKELFTGQGAPQV